MNETYPTIDIGNGRMQKLVRELQAELASLKAENADLRKAQDYGQRHDEMNNSIALHEQRATRRKLRKNE